MQSIFTFKYNYFYVIDRELYHIVYLLVTFYCFYVYTAIYLTVLFTASAMHTVYNERKKLFIYLYKVVFSITLYLPLTLYCNSLYAQQYYWEKASGFPDTEAGIEAVTDLEAADGIIRYNNKKYAYEGTFDFKPIETLVNNDGTTPGNFFWTGPEGKWIFDEDRNSMSSPVYTLDPATRQLQNMCNISDYGFYGVIDQENIVFFKNRYYTLGSIVGNDSRDMRVFRRYNAATCQWNEIPTPTNDPRFPLNKLVSDGDNLYVFSGNDMVIFASNDAINWNELQPPASLLNNRGWYPQQKMASDKRGLILLQKMEEDYITGVNLSRFFILKDQTFTQLDMGGDQPKIGYWGDFKLFDSGNLFSLSFDKKELMKSTDKGNSWIKIATENVPEDINDYIETKDGNIYIGTASGVYVLKKFKDSPVTGCTDLTFKKKITNEVRCKKGAATFYVDGGLGPYTISFQNKLYHTADSLMLPELQNGYYEIRIQDRSNCYIDTDFYVNIDIKSEMEVIFTNKDTCSSDYIIVMQYGYAPYIVTWKEGTEEKKQIVAAAADGYSPSVAVLNLTIEQPYQIAVSDQSGCKGVLSPSLMGGFFNPGVTYTGTDNCDSILVNITVPHARAADTFVLTIRNDLYQIIKTEQWTGALYKGKVAHNAYYTFEISADQTYCYSSFSKLFTKPELVSFTTSDIYCNGPIDIKGQVNLQLLNFDSNAKQIIWSDIGANNATYRIDLDPGIYSFEIPEETGCGIKKTFEIKKEVPDIIIPEIPFLCPGEIFHLVPATTDHANPILFEVLDQNNQYRYLNDGEGIDIINEFAASYTITALNRTNNCSGASVKVVVETPDSLPVLPANTYTFCAIGDKVLLKADSHNAYWYATSDNKLLGTGVSLLYTTTRPMDSVYVQLQNEDGTCTSLSAFVKLTLSDLVKPEIKVVSVTSTKMVLKPVSSKSQSGRIIYSWYGDAGFISIGDSLVVENGQWNFIQLEAKDKNDCIAEKSEKYYPQFSLGIKDSNVEKFLTVFPNPTRDRLVVQINEGFVGLLKVKDMNGKNIFQSNIEQTTEVSLSECASGTYIIEVQLDNQELLHILVVKY